MIQTISQGHDPSTGSDLSVVERDFKFKALNIEQIRLCQLQPLSLA